ncbi:hypothetical protein [Nonomuraea endophytica]|uniref:Uncharacterized protein n=1 Tax=Nonomuraea endophytica TaxID=714136 RepID=A0A7W8EE98_9ACTN|nr:hypothetical protein [Nonomuraea endophytica]MBB5077425.1 hypothetical protein [Nonomuraea endophytica]
MERYYELNAPPPDLPAVLGPGGDDVLALLDGLSVAPGRVPDEVDGLPVRRVGQVPSALLDRVEPGWLAALEGRRARARTRLVAAGRETRLELAEHVAMLVATPRLEPAEPGDGDALAQSGAILWLLGTLVAAALADEHDDATPTVRADRLDDTTLTGLVARGWWPVGPVDGAFVIAPLTLPRTCHA